MFVTAAFLGSIFRRRKKHMGYKTLEFDFHTITAATDGFSDIVGRGGFSSVYKGKLPSGQDIVVKMLSGNLPRVEKGFHNECQLLSRLQHKNLINLLGFCCNRNRFFLVFEFMPNSSLDCFIRDPLRASQLPWEICSDILGGIARGLRYLHEECGLHVVHRDINPTNILLDAEMNPKIAGFELARQIREYESPTDSTEIAGTVGYLAPENYISGRFSVKSDVYCFGILILEIISRKRALQPGDEHLVTYARSCWSEGRSLDIIHPGLREDESIIQIPRYIHIALLCVQENVEARPDIDTVLHWLSCSSVALPVPATTVLSTQYESPSSPFSSLASSDGEVV